MYIYIDIHFKICDVWYMKSGIFIFSIWFLIFDIWQLIVKYIIEFKFNI